MIPHIANPRIGPTAVLAALAAVAACSQPAQTGAQADAASAAPAAPAATTATTAANPDALPIAVGALQAVALFDGEMTLPNDNQVLGVGRTRQEVAQILTAAGQPGDQFKLYRRPLLLRDGERIVLFDTGMGAAAGGRLLTALAAAGVQPAQVTDVLISHAHTDHVGGLVDASGGLVFANATIRMSAAEWAAMQANGEQAALVRAIAPRVQAFQPGAQVIANVTAAPVPGHTPGHTAYDIASGDQHLLYVADTVHHFVVSVRRPDWTNGFDGDPATARASRRALLQRAADQNLRLYAYHFPPPGVGRVRAEGDGFAWAPES